MIPFLLLAAQAAGMIIDYQSTQNQIAMGRIGTQLEKAAIGANLQATRLQAADQSLQAMMNLRQTLGSQAAVLAARGTRGNAGSALMIGQESVSRYNADERARRMNLLAREAELRASNVLSGMHQLTSETQLGQALTKRFINMIPTNPSAYSQMFSGGGATGGNFGMTPAQG